MISQGLLPVPLGLLLHNLFLFKLPIHKPGEANQQQDRPHDKTPLTHTKLIAG